MAKTPDLIPLRGAVAEPLLLEITGELTHEDLARLSKAPKVGTPVIQRLKAIHHRQASLLAEGRTVKEIAAIVGCTPQRIVQLQTDPAFADLVAYYGDQIMAARLNDASRLQDKILDLGEMAVDELRDRMEDEGRRKTMPVGEVRKIAEFAMDRTVAPPKAAPASNQAPASVTINFGTGLRPPPTVQPSAPTIDLDPETNDLKEGENS